ncbi:PREDICTED: uncharacterized protein LOC102020471 [Chinchilla lanigera]|uniref:uncharacterized protein LOC102020471 n=1 Tax=Chinchilla lanigera TaxID=34839 RepID=UPI00038EA3B9|nr:PREDICTED: uncharacterized protein LOC102020471 [Chinchilla lanigera]
MWSSPFSTRQIPAITQLVATPHPGYQEVAAWLLSGPVKVRYMKQGSWRDRVQTLLGSPGQQQSPGGRRQQPEHTTSVPYQPHHSLPRTVSALCLTLEFLSLEQHGIQRVADDEFLVQDHTAKLETGLQQISLPYSQAHSSSFSTVSCGADRWEGLAWKSLPALQGHLTCREVGGLNIALEMVELLSCKHLLAESLISWNLKDLSYPIFKLIFHFLDFVKYVVALREYPVAVKEYPGAVKEYPGEARWRDPPQPETQTSLKSSYTEELLGPWALEFEGTGMPGAENTQGCGLQRACRTHAGARCPPGATSGTGRPGPWTSAQLPRKCLRGGGTEGCQDAVGHPGFHFSVLGRAPRGALCTSPGTGRKLPSPQCSSGAPYRL